MRSGPVALVTIANAPTFFHHEVTFALIADGGWFAWFYRCLATQRRGWRMVGTDLARTSKLSNYPKCTENDGTLAGGGVGRGRHEK